MQNELFYNKPECEICTRSIKEKFSYVESKKGELFEYQSMEGCTLIFILSGKVQLSCNEFMNVPFHAEEMCLLPISAQCVWKALEDTTVMILSGKLELNCCDQLSFEVNAGKWLNVTKQFDRLPIKSPLSRFLDTVKVYLHTSLKCPMIYQLKQNELSLLLKLCYSQEELVNFFLPLMKHNLEFEQFIMRNYLNIKGVKEFVNLSGMHASTFNRKFKTHFGMSPYQWMIKQKAKHILHELNTRNKTIAEIMRKFEFSDASHFNRYCKTMFGSSPSEIRSNRKVTSAERD